VKTTGPINDTMKKLGLHERGPKPRNYCRKWVWAPDRKRALFCGANAGVPHRFNDVWEYDLASNTWGLLYEPDADFNAVRQMKPEQKSAFNKTVPMVKDGILMTSKGAPFDPIHSLWQITQRGQAATKQDSRCAGSMPRMKTVPARRTVTDTFLSRHADKIAGTLSCCDRVVDAGTAPRPAASRSAASRATTEMSSRSRPPPP
jgi:hypothetical protein